VLNLNQMETTPEARAPELEIERLTTFEYFLELLQGFGIALGLAILWGLEIARNTCFSLFDRLNIKPRHKRSSAFPPGRPRKHRQLRVSS
jgi:hypothetical protein